MSTVSPVAPGAPIPFSGTMTPEHVALARRVTVPRQNAFWPIVTALATLVLMLLYGTVGVVPDNMVLQESLARLQFIVDHMLASRTVWIGAGIIAAAWALFKLVERRRWKKLWATERKVFGSIGASGIAWNASGILTTRPWSGVKRICRDPDMLVVFTSPAGVLYFPRLFFANDDAWHEANRLSTKHAPQASQRQR